MAMNGLTKMAATALFLVLAIVPAAIAVTHTVGDAPGWDSGVDYTEWVKGKTFTVGDTLEFKYGRTHTVDVVDKAGYDGCDASGATEKHSDGDTDIDLNTAGIKYFICATPGHCVNGMKLAVTVVAAGTPATPSTPPTTPTTPDSPPASPTPTTPTPGGGAGSTSSPPPPKPSGASKGVVSYVLVGVSMVLGYGLFM